MEPDIFHKITFMSISNFYFKAHLQTAFLFKNYFVVFYCNCDFFIVNFKLLVLLRI